jgi:hypothetical protein
MKYLFLILLSLPFMAYAQSYALLHRQMLHPVSVTNQLESDSIPGHYFPVYTTDLDAMIHVLDQYIDSMDQREYTLFEKEVSFGHSRLLIHKLNKKPGRSITLSTRAKDRGFVLELVHKNDSKRHALQKMKAFLYYLRNNRFLVQEKKGLVPATGH